MEKFKQILTKIWPHLILLGIVLILALTNFTAGKYLTGGDNLHSELNSFVNLKRNIFGAWQEHQGLGLLGGMSHASDIFRQIFLIILALFIPDNLIRWIYAFMTLFIGSVGAFYLSRKAISSFWKKDLLSLNLLSLTGGLFYLLNLATIQSFFVPFEAFMHHFAFLPWLILSVTLYFKNPNIKTLALSALVAFLATPASYVSTLFLVYISSSILISIFYFSKTKRFITTFLKFYLVTFLVNTFWILPFIFFSLTSSDVNLNAKINQMATGSIYLQNKEFGGITDVVQLKGFWLNYIEPNVDGTFAYMFSSWRDHLSNPIINLIGYLMFFIVSLGAIFSIKNRSKTLLGVTAVFIFSIVMLTTATPPFSWLNDFLRENIPLFNQVFRFPFTKFSILASLSFSILFPIGIIFISDLIKRNSRNTYIISFIISSILIISFVLPVFKGNLFYEREKLEIPNEYFKTFDYFKSQDKTKRIANLPQYTFWGWSFYDWGYSGGGFTWYGIEQPILDRNFDMWNSKNENYYWELSQAIYSKNPDEFLKVLNKYDVSYLLVDKNIVSVSPKSLFIPETEDLINQIPQIKKERDFGSIQIYKVELENNPDKFVNITTNLSSSNSYKWSNFDPSYKLGSNYITHSDDKNADFYPFKSLFTGKNEDQISFTTEENDKYIDFISNLNPSENVNLHLPSLATKNNTLPVNITAEVKEGELNIGIETKSPEVLIKENNKTKKIWESVIERNIFSVLETETYYLNINGISNFEIKDIKSKKIIGTTSLSLDQNNSLVLSNLTNEIDSTIIDGDELKNYFIQDDAYITLSEIKPKSQLILRVTKTNDNYSSLKINPVEKINNKETKIVNCDNFREDFFSYEFTNEGNKKLSLKSKNASPCISFYTSSLDHDQSYFVSVKNKNIKGQSIHFWVLNEDQKTPIIDTFFEKNKKETVSKFILPPMEKFGKAYSFHFDNISIGNEEANNILGEININPIPYHFLNNVKISDSTSKPIFFEEAMLKISHPNESLYLIKSENKGRPFAFSISQTYSPYWHAYEVKNSDSKINKYFPFLGKKVTKHYEMNNWKNAWTVNSTQKQTSIVVIYMPQYLVYLGLILSFITLLLILLRLARKAGKIDRA